MATAKLTSKCQVTVPAEVRRALGLRPGGRIVFAQASSASFTVTAEGPSLMSLAGSLKAPRPATLQDMERAVMEGAAETMRHAGT
jgi:AbrB family looped-hinge helix DNA binding protein